MAVQNEIDGIALEGFFAASLKPNFALADYNTHRTVGSLLHNFRFEFAHISPDFT